MRKRALLPALIFLLLMTDVGLAGPLWWLRPRNWGRRRTTNYNYSQVDIPASMGEDAPVTAGMNLDVIQAMHQTDCAYRNRAGLGSLVLHSKLCEVAQRHAENMARTYRMSHYLGGSPWDRAFAAGWHASASENIARGYNSVAAAYNGWYYSRGHRLNMLGSHTYCGFGYAVAADGERFWAAMYSD